MSHPGAVGPGFCDPKRHGVPHSSRPFDGSHARMHAFNATSVCSCRVGFQKCVSVTARCMQSVLVEVCFCTPFSLSLCLSRLFWWIFSHVRTLPWSKSLVNGTGDETPN